MDTGIYKYRDKLIQRYWDTWIKAYRNTGIH